MRRALTKSLGGLLLPLALHAQAPAGPLTLGGAARLAAQRATGAAVGAFRAEAAEARAAEARSALLPNVSASFGDGQRTFNTASFGLTLPGFDPAGEIRGPVRTVDMRGRVSVPVYSPTALERYRTAQAAAAGANRDAEVAADLAGTTAALSYVRLVRAEAQVAARAADSALAGELLDIARRQLSAGTGVGLDVTRAQAQLASVRTAQIAARAERDRSRVALLRALDLPLDAPLVLGDSLGALARDEAAQPASTVRPDVLAAEAAVRTAERALSAVRAEGLPTVSVFADDGATSNGYAKLLNTYSYGLQLSVPIFEGFRGNARKDVQQAAVREAQARLHELQSQAEADVTLARMELSSAREQLEASADRLRLAEQEVSQARERFRAGVAGNADVIAAQLSLDLARSQHIEVQTALVSARVALARAQGRVTQLP